MIYHLRQYRRKSNLEGIENIFTEIFHEHYQRQDSLSKSYEETILSIISSNTKITTQQLDKFNEKIEENANIIERPEKQNHDFSESLNSFHWNQADKVEQVKKNLKNSKSWITKERIGRILTINYIRCFTTTLKSQKETLSKAK